MGFAERLLSGGFPVSLEITPPRRPKLPVLLRRAGLLGRAADAINVIQRPDRQASLDASIALHAHGFDPVWHLAARGRELSDVAAELRRGEEAGVRQVLCVLGDHATAGQTRLRVRDVVAEARRAAPSLLVGATLNQYVPDQAAALRNLAGKIEAGAAYVQMQPVFDLAVAVHAVEPLKRRFPSVRVVPMVMPLLEAQHALVIGSRLGIAMPGGFVDRIALGIEDAWDVFGEMVAGLRALPDLFDGLAVMTFETDPEPATGSRIAAAVGRAGPGS